MRKRRAGLTTLEIVLMLVVVVMAVGGVVLWQRVDKLHTWAVAVQDWQKTQLYPWIKNNSFQQGPGSGGGNPDGIKPPPPPDGL